MEKIVYIFGAGFSVPFGIPSMSDFLTKSKDLYLSDKTQYAYFEKIFQLIDDLAKIKNYCNADLFNIEDILSLLEMGSVLGDNPKESSEYKQYIKDVIEAYTKEIIPYNNDNRLPGNYEKFLLGNDNNSKARYFIASLYGLRINKNNGSFFSEPSKSTNNYSAITLNYDMVVENIIDFINAYYSQGDRKHVLYKDTYPDNIDSKFIYCKLHGSLDSDIIPPIWNKYNHETVMQSWKTAYSLIKEASQIRILGYSLPKSDNYVKYLLSIGLKNSYNVKNIDVITLDSDGATRERYEELFCFNRFRFKNERLETYFEKIIGKNISHPKNNGQFQYVQFDAANFETEHHEFMKDWYLLLII